MEIDTFCQDVIRGRIADGFFPKKSVIHGDITTFQMSQVEHLEPEGLIAGWPCQATPLVVHLIQFRIPFSIEKLNLLLREL